MKRLIKTNYCFAMTLFLSFWVAISISCAQKECISPEEAHNYIGKTKTVCGTVASTKYAIRSRGQPTFLNLNRPYPNHIFTVLIWGSYRHIFKKPPEVFYKGKRICVTGEITAYRGKPQIVIKELSQIKIKTETSK